MSDRKPGDFNDEKESQITPTPGDTRPPRPRQEYAPPKDGHEAPPVYTGRTPVRRPDGRPRPPVPHGDHPSHTGRRPAPSLGEPPRRPIHPDDRRRRPEGPMQSHPTNPPRRRATKTPPPQRHPQPEDYQTHDPTPPPRRRARRRTQFAAVYIVITVIAVGIGLTAFALNFDRIFDRTQAYGDYAVHTPTPAPTPQSIDTNNLTGLVTHVDAYTNPRSITLMDISNNSENSKRVFSFLDTTSLANRSGISMPFGHISIGNVMEVAYNPENSELISLNQSFTRDFHSRTGLRINMEDYTITIGNDVLNFTNQTLVMYRGSTRPIEEITPDDTLTIIALQDTIWLIEVESGHGFLQLINTDNIEGGRIILDPIGPGSNRVSGLDEMITIPEGTYRVTVEGRNIETYTTEVTIRHGETTTLDLGEMEPGESVLEITVRPAGSRVYINGELTSLHIIPEFEFGELVEIRVTREGFYTYERTIEMNQATVSVVIDLEEETVMGQLSIVTTPIGADIWVGDQLIGTSPVSTELEPGRHTVTAAMDGFYTYSTLIDVDSGHNSLNLQLTGLTPEPTPEPIPTQEPEPEYVPIPTPPPLDPDEIIWPDPPAGEYTYYDEY